MIRKATEHDIDAVERGYNQLLYHEAENGSRTNWQLGVYPTRETAQKSLADQTLYVLEEDGEICASMILNQLQPEVYRDIQWVYPAQPESIFLIHTLCIPPAKAGKGLGTKMVQGAIEMAKEKNCKVIRLDTYAENKPAASLYQKLGFRYAGKAATLHEGVIPEELIFFEKQVEREDETKPLP